MTALAVLAVAALFVVLMSAHVALEAWAIKLLWAWFIVPQFHLDPLSTKSAIGLGLVAALLTHQVQPEIKSDESKSKTATKYLARVFFVPITAVAIGRVVLWWFS